MKKKVKNKVKDDRPFAERHPKLNLLLGFMLLLIILALTIIVVYIVAKMIGTGVINIVKFIKNQLSKLEAVVVVALITGTVSLIGVLFTSVISKLIENKQKRRDYLNQHREEAYKQFVDLVYKIQDNTRNNIPVNTVEIISKMDSFSKELTLWGSNRVIKKWIKFRTQDDIKNPTENLLVLESILYAIRKDMGYRGMRKGILLSFFVNDFNKSYKKYKEEKTKK